MRGPILLLVIAPALCAQQVDPWDELVSLARTTPPEFTADALLRIAAKTKRLPLITEAFETASTATWKMRLTPAINNLHTDSREGMLYDAMALEMDALSLQCRAVRAALAIDPPRARDLFTQIPPPRIPAYSCKEPLVASPQIYYQVAGELVKGAFTAEERSKREHLRLIESLARTATSIVQLEPLAELILSTEADAEGFANLATALASALNSVDLSDRAFRLPFALNQRIYEIAGRCRKQESPGAGLAVMQAWRSAMVQHFNGARCSDNFARGRNPSVRAAQADPLANGFRYPGLAPLSDQEVTPLRVIDEAPEQHDYWQSAQANSAAAAVRRMQPADVLAVLQEFDAWKPGAEASPVDYFQQKMMLYRTMIPAIPQGAIRNQATSHFMAFLLAAALLRESPVEWYQAASKAGLWADYERSGNPILVLNARWRTLSINSPTASPRNQ